MDYLQLTDDECVEIHNAAERHLTECWIYLDEDNTNDDHDFVEPQSPSCAPFCGCDTCVVREVLHAGRDALHSVLEVRLKETLGDI